MISQNERCGYNKQQIKDIVYLPEAAPAARILVETGSFHVDTSLPFDKWFTWRCGIKAPCYCNCRHLNCYPVQRRYIADALAKSVRHSFPEAKIILGVASAGIPWASYIAERLNLPLAYVRSSAKSYGVKFRERSQ